MDLSSLGGGLVLEVHANVDTAGGLLDIDGASPGSGSSDAEGSEAGENGSDGQLHFDGRLFVCK